MLTEMEGEQTIQQSVLFSVLPLSNRPHKQESSRRAGGKTVHVTGKMREPGSSALTSLCSHNNIISPDWTDDSTYFSELVSRVQLTMQTSPIVYVAMDSPTNDSNNADGLCGHSSKDINENKEHCQQDMPSPLEDKLWSWKVQMMKEHSYQLGVS